MAAFYENQRTLQIRANPADVIEAIKAAGVPSLKESQIKRWWSTYHRKQKEIAEDLMEEARHLRSRQGTIYDIKMNFCFKRTVLFVYLFLCNNRDSMRALIGQKAIILSYQ